MCPSPPYGEEKSSPYLSQPCCISGCIRCCFWESTTVCGKENIRGKFRFCNIFSKLSGLSFPFGLILRKPTPFIVKTHDLVKYAQRPGAIASPFTTSEHPRDGVFVIAEYFCYRWRRQVKQKSGHKLLPWEI